MQTYGTRGRHFRVGPPSKASESRDIWKAFCLQGTETQLKLASTEIVVDSQNLEGLGEAGLGDPGNLGDRSLHFPFHLCLSASVSESFPPSGWTSHGVRYRRGEGEGLSHPSLVTPEKKTKPLF